VSGHRPRQKRTGRVPGIRTVPEIATTGRKKHRSTPMQAFFAIWQGEFNVPLHIADGFACARPAAPARCRGCELAARTTVCCGGPPALLARWRLAARRSATATPALAAQPGVTQDLAPDPYTPPQPPRPPAQHATEVGAREGGTRSRSARPSFPRSRSLARGSFNRPAATDIGFAISRNGGVSWTHGFRRARAGKANAARGPFFSVSRTRSVAYNARARVWIISWLGAHFSAARQS
jgi:hypothetical protein